MSRACREYREEWLRDRARSVHTDACATCAAWTLSVGQQIAALSGLPRVASPSQLDSRLERELGNQRDERLSRVLSSMVRHGAPGALDERVADQIAQSASSDASPTGQEASGERKAQVVRALDIQSAPHVLERLVDEELRAPEAARSERFSSSLERLNAPPSLELRIEASARRKAFLRLVLGPLVTLTAAGLVVWLMARGGEETRREYSFQVVEASSLEGLDPMALQLAQILGGSAGGPR